MFIIVEGVDCSGKSTFIDELMKNTENSFHIRRSDRPKTNQTTEIGRLKRSFKIVRDLYKQVIQPNQGHLIVERYYPSELVYSKVKRGYEAFNDKFYSSFEGELKSLFEGDLIIIHVFQELKILQQRLLVRGDDYINEEDLSELNTRYIEFLERTAIDSYSIPGTPEGIRSAINYLNSVCSDDFKL